MLDSSRRCYEAVTSDEAGMAGILVGLLILLVTRPEEAEAARYNCAIENVTAVAESNSATVTWDTSADCEKVRVKYSLCII